MPNAEYAFPYTCEMLRFLVFSALGYGAQGIVYSDYKGDIATNSLVNRLGSKTELWLYSQLVNREVQKYNDIFVNCEVKRVQHTGSAVTDSEITGGSAVSEPLESITVTVYPGNNTNTKGVMISYLSNGPDNYVMILNHNVELPVSVQMKFLEKYAVRELTPTSILNNGATSSGRTINRVLHPGGYIILQWSKPMS